jgi:hypothetical protein
MGVLLTKNERAARIFERGNGLELADVSSDSC